MTNSKKKTILNLVTYLSIIILNIFFVSEFLGDIDSIAGGSLETPNYAGLIAGVVMLFGLLSVLACDVLLGINVILKIMQISFDKWGFSVPSIVINCLLILFSGRVAIPYLFADSPVTLVLCFAVLGLEMLALVMECAVIASRKKV